MRSLAAMALTLTAVTAQSPLTTLFQGTNGGSVGGVVMFDLTVILPTTITQIDVNTGVAVGTAGTLEVRTCATSFLGNENNPAAWTTLTSGDPLTAQGLNVPTPVALATPIALPPGSHGIMLKADTWGHRYTNGTNPGNGNVYSTAEMTLSAGSAQNTQYVGLFNPRVANVSIHYTTSGGAIATKTLFGTRCGPGPRMIHELFPHGAAVDLVNRNFAMIHQPSPDNYLVVQGAAPPYDPVTAAANGVNITAGPWTTVAGTTWDDASLHVTLPFSFPYPDGTGTASTTDIMINSNGRIYLGDSSGDNTFASNGANSGYTPTSFQGSTGAGLPVIAGHMCDLDPSASGGGAIYYEAASPNGGVRITWAGVPNWQNGTYTPAAVINDIQMELLPSGQVNLAYGPSLGNGGSTGNVSIVGYSVGGGAPFSAPIDWSAITVVQSGTGGQPLALDTDARPVTGTTFNVITSNIPAASVIGVTLLDFGTVNPGVSLAGLGAPGCWRYTNPLVLFVFFPSAGTGSFPFRLGAVANGFSFVMQSAAFDPAQNALGVISSNGVELLFNPN